MQNKNKNMQKHQKWQKGTEWKKEYGHFWKE
jgi:hypothetical protein